MGGIVEPYRRWRVGAGCRRQGHTGEPCRRGLRESGRQGDTVGEVPTPVLLGD